jgi:hypothetical protein
MGSFRTSSLAPTIRLLMVLAISLCLSSSGDAASSDDGPLPRVATSVSQTIVQIAEPFDFEIRVSVEEGTDVDFPKFGEPLGAFQILQTTSSEDVPSEDGRTRTWTNRYRLETYTSGEFEIPEIEIQIVKQGVRQTVRSKPQTMRVKSLLEDRSAPANFRDIKPAADVEIAGDDPNRWIGWTTGGSLAALGLIVLLAVMRRREDTITPREFATGELERLGNSQAVNNGESQAVLDSVSAILREYLLLEFEICAPTLTTQELLNEFSVEQQPNRSEAEQLSSLLSLADQAKFAGVQIDRPQLSRTIQAATRLVHSLADHAETQPIPDSDASERK